MAWIERVRRYWVGIFLLVAITFVSEYMRVTIPKLSGSFSLNPSWLVIAAVLQVLFWSVTAINWRLICAESIGFQLSLWQSFRHCALLNIGKYVPGKVWGLFARGADLAERGATGKAIARVSFLELYLLFTTAAMVATAATAMLSTGWCAALLMLLALGTFPVSALALRLGWRLWRSLRRIPLTPFYCHKLTYSSGYLLTALGWVLNGLILFSLHAATQLPQPAVTLIPSFVFANTVAVTLGFIALFAPAGIGIREGMIAFLLGSTMPVQDALFLALVFRIWLLMFDVLFVLILAGHWSFKTTVSNHSKCA